MTRFATLIRRLADLDRRWIFLGMLVAVFVPTYWQQVFPEVPSELTRDAFAAIENLPAGSRVLIALDYDPAAEGELTPMSTAFVRHCSLKRHKMYFVTLWPLGTQLINEQIEGVIKKEFPNLVYGMDYVNLGYREGREAVINAIATNLREQFATDADKTNLNDIPMTRDVKSLQDMVLIINVSAGYAGTKEWVQYACTKFGIPIVSGLTGVQSPLFYPYLPFPLVGMLAAIKGAAEYEAALAEQYPQAGYDDPLKNEGRRRMGPQLIAHLYMIGLIVAGNVLFFLDRRARR
jgi:hypothetical protein